jgi:hypothetical protein
MEPAGPTPRAGGAGHRAGPTEPDLSLPATARFRTASRKGRCVIVICSECIINSECYPSQRLQDELLREEKTIMTLPLSSKGRDSFCRLSLTRACLRREALHSMAKGGER